MNSDKWPGNWEGVRFPLTYDFITAIRNLLIEEIKLMRMVHSDTINCWYCGGATIGDLSCGKWLETSFGDKDSVDWIREKSDVFVTLEFDDDDERAK